MVDSMKTGIERAIEAVGLSHLAAKLGESKQAVWNWKWRGQPPAGKCLAIEAITGVSRRDLRSDWADYWPVPQPKKPSRKQKAVEV